LKKFDKEYLNFITEQNHMEKIKFLNKKEAEKRLFSDLRDDMINYKSEKLNSKEKERENGRKILVEFDKLMEKKDQERNEYREQIRSKAKIQDLRQSLVKNVKEEENEIKNQIEMKYQKEKVEIELR
jgi:hypothetical protein